MEAQTFTMLNVIDVLKTSTSTLKVRVPRLWSIKDNKNVNEDFLIEMVLMDEEENRIQATVYKQDIFRFKRFLKESSTLTTVNPSTNVSNVKDKNKLTMELCDLSGNCVYLTLWDHYASELSKYVIDHFDEPHAVIVLLFGRVKYYTSSDGKEKVYVSNSFGSNVSRLFINDYLFEIEEYKNNLFDLLNSNDVAIRKPIPVKMLSSVDDEFLKSTDLFNSCDICTIIFPKNIIILGTIKAICPDTEWYYIDCNTCSRKLMENIGEGVTEYECKTVRCNVLGVLPTPRLKIKIRVQDLTGVVSLTLFDRYAKMLINKTANEVENGGFPAELDCLLKKKFPLKVDVTEFNFRNSVEDHGINKLTNDTNILTELQKRQHSRLRPDSNSVSLGASMSKFQSSGSVSVKISDVGDN
ncbi:uncharacterized protein LOC143573699 [Bidens hawaiensis]|uniref:uncharacterized protein LOC143573699 n=1 Tax=Bidens hawaiensis TaxID=980011 RepID=UPI004049114A